MTNRIPLIVDTADGNKIKELPLSDNLDLTGSGIVNATSISSTGALTVASINVGGSALAAIATTADYDDLVNTPIAFTGDYNDLSNKPFIPLRTNDLQNVASTAPTQGQALIWNNINLQYEPGSIVSTIDLSDRNIQELQNVIISGSADNKYLKYYAGAWRAANVTYAEVQSKPTTLSGYGITDAATSAQGTLADSAIQSGTADAITATMVAANVITTRELADGNNYNGTFAGNLTGDVKGSVFGDDSTLLVDGVNGKLVGDYENSTSTITSTRVQSYDIKALQDTNTNDLYVVNKIYGGETGTPKNVAIGSTAPSTSNGASGDLQGMIAFDSTYIYYCTASYTDGVADIWKRVAWSADTW